MVIFGGFGGVAALGYQSYSETWTVSLSGDPAWTLITPNGVPSARFSHTGVYDPERQRMVVFGGYDGSYQSDVWTLELSGPPRWDQILPLTVEVQESQSDELRLARVWPNPVRGEMWVALALSGTGPVTVELLDLSGRRLVRREIEDPRARVRKLSIAELERVPPGLYFLRLSQAAKSRITKIAVIR